MQVTEPLNGGLVQTRHATLLKPGEVQRCDEMILKPGDPSPSRAPGRTPYGTVKTTAITCTPAGAALSSAAAFGTDTASVVVTAGSNIITKASAFAAVTTGQTVVGTGIPPGTFVKRVIDAGLATSAVELTKLATAGGTVTVTFSDLHPGTFISGTEITTGTYISAITDASNLTMSAAASGTTTASRTFSEPVTGLVSLAFSGAADFLLLAKAADKVYSSSLTALTGTFSSLITGLSQDPEATLQAVRHLNRHIVFTGFDRPRVVFYKNNTVSARALGMAPVADFVGASVVAGSWSALETFQNGWYYFLVTEVYNPGSPDEVESTYTGDPKAAHITDYLTQSVRVTRNEKVANDGLYGRNSATHWRVYMAPKQSEEFPAPDLSTFRAIGDPIPIASTETVLSDTNPYQTTYARTYAVNGTDAPFFTTGGAVSTVAAQDVTSCTFTAGSNILTHGSSGFSTVAAGMVVTSPNNRIPYGTVVVSKTSANAVVLSKAATSSGSETVGFGNSSPWDTVLGLCPTNPSGQTRGALFTNFGVRNVGGFSSGTVTGIRFRMRGTFQADSGEDRGFYVALSKDGTNYGTEYWVSIIGPMAFGFGLWECGGQFDTWGLSWSPADFIDGSTFKVRVRKHSSAVDINHRIDGVEITVYEGGNTVNMDGDPFKTVVISDQIGNAFGIGAAGEPPICTTGDIINGMFVSDDINSAADLVATLPDEIDATPDVYRLPLDDRIRVVRAYGHGGIIGCENTVKRLNYFPRETDADFSRGRATENIASDHGMAGPLSAALVDLPGRGTVLAYLSTQKGMQWTDAVTSTPLNEDLDWPNLIEPTLIHRSVLKVYPKYYLLALFYVPYGGTRRTKVMFFSYHPLHMKENYRLPAFGPVTCNAGSATSLVLNGASRLFTGHSMDGKVYLEDTGTTDEYTVVPAMTLRTRRFYASRIGHEGRIERVYLVVDPAGNSTTGGFTATMYRQNQNEDLAAIHTLSDSHTRYGGVVELWPNDMLETFEIEFTKSTAQTAAFRPHYLQFQDERNYGPAKLT